MRLQVPKWHVNSFDCGTDVVVDQETGKSVGTISHMQNYGRDISLFDGKYRGNFKSHAECAAFAKGVEAVLNHIVSVKVKRSSEAA